MTSPSFYTPRAPSALDTLRYTQRVADQMLRNNPLHNATVDAGLMKWLGNYDNNDGSGKIAYLWIGEFFPRDPNLDGDPPQKGIVMFRDDSRNGADGFAFALYDHAPSTPGGLKQTLHMNGGDGQSLYREHRDGGLDFPWNNVQMGPRDSDLLLWPGTNSGSFSSIYEGQFSVVGSRLHYRMWGACTGGSNGQLRLRCESSGSEPDAIGPTHALGINANDVFEDSIDISAFRGRNVRCYWETRILSGAGKCRSALIFMHNRSF